VTSNINPRFPSPVSCSSSQSRAKCRRCLARRTPFSSLRSSFPTPPRRPRRHSIRPTTSQSPLVRVLSACSSSFLFHLCIFLVLQARGCHQGRDRCCKGPSVPPVLALLSSSQADSTSLASVNRQKTRPSPTSTRPTRSKTRPLTRCLLRSFLLLSITCTRDRRSSFSCPSGCDG
jgi:hypothetical protein